MPTGLPNFFEGDITKVEPNAYGFFRCKIKSPNYIEHPIVQRKIRTDSGIRTIAGIGSWIGIIHSEEMKNAKIYEFEVLGGVLFKTGFIFKKYVEDLYNMRKTYAKTDPMNLICKLLLNSLYGKFSQSLTHDTLEIYDISSDEKITSVMEYIDGAGTGVSIKDWIFLGSKALIIEKDHKSTYQKGILENGEYDDYYGMNVNIAIGASVTSMARVVMSYYKNNPLWKLFYSDTDSIIIDRKLPEYMVGEAMGLMKLENRISAAIFLCPKVYYLITDEGEHIKKIKGVSHEQVSKITFDDFNDLLYKNESK